MNAPERRIAVLGAPSSIGIRPYDDAPRPRELARAPGVLRELGLIERLRAEDLGNVTPPPYRDLTRPPDGIRNEAELEQYNRQLADRLAPALSGGRFPIVIGGDCSIILGALLGVRRSRDRIGLVYVDAHADFATPQESRTGSAASMCLALAVGRGASPLARLTGAEPLVRARDVALVGRRDQGQWYGEEALGHSGALDIPWAVAASRVNAVHRDVLARLDRPELDGFWVHVDADVLDPQVMPAVDSPEPGGPDGEALAAIVGPLVRHPKALGLQVTIYDPGLDPDRSCGARLVSILEAIAANVHVGGER